MDKPRLREFLDQVKTITKNYSDVMKADPKIGGPIQGVIDHCHERYGAAREPQPATTIAPAKP